jgi:hypothetical protein
MIRRMSAIWGPTPAFVPMLMFAIVFGLSMDYEVFLLSRVHEAWVKTSHAHRSVAIGGTARVITTAAPSWSSSSLASCWSPTRPSRCSRSKLRSRDPDGLGAGGHVAAGQALPETETEPETDSKTESVTPVA